MTLLKISAACWSKSHESKKMATKFLWWYFRSNTFREILEIELPNGIKTELKASRLLALSIPLPPLAEQQRIVARIEALSSQIARAKQLQQEIATEAEGLCLSLISKDREATQVPMSELLELKRPDVEVRPDEIYQFAGVYSFGRGVFKGVKRLGMEFSYTHLTTLKTNDFVYPKLMAWEGAMAIVPPEYDGYVVSTEFPVFRVKENRVLPETLATYFKNPAIWPKISGVSTGTNVRRRRLNPKEFLRYNFTLPSMQTQVQLREIRVKVACIINDQLGLVRNLESLMPSILAKAFKGEL
jgi:type I restriction enzyme S subunit